MYMKAPSSAQSHAKVPPTYHTDLNFTASISVLLHPREQCWHGNCRLYVFLFFPISSHMSFLLASGSGKFRLIALLIWGNKEEGVCLQIKPILHEERAEAQLRLKKPTKQQKTPNYNNSKKLIRKSYTCLKSSKQCQEKNIHQQLCQSDQSRVKDRMD